MDYEIIVRSYKRNDSIHKKTLKILKHNNLLEKTVLLVANEDEYENYRKSLEENSISLKDIVITEKGCAETLNNYLKRIPLGSRIYCMDDDLVDCYSYENGDISKKRRVENLDEYFQYCFEMQDIYNFGAFSLNSMNYYFVKHRNFATRGICKFGGFSFGGKNIPEFRVDRNHNEDTIRQAQVWKKYGSSFSINWIYLEGSKCDEAPGGMKGSEERKDTKLENEKLILERPELFDFISPEHKILNKNSGSLCLDIKKRKDLKEIIRMSQEKDFNYFSKTPIEKENYEIFSLE